MSRTRTLHRISPVHRGKRYYNYLEVAAAKLIEYGMHITDQRDPQGDSVIVFSALCDIEREIKTAMYKEGFYDRHDTSYNGENLRNFLREISLNTPGKVGGIRGIANNIIRAMKKANFDLSVKPVQRYKRALKKWKDHYQNHLVA